MALPLVLIEVAPQPASGENQAAMIAACNEAVRSGRCVVTGEASSDQTPAALAIVSWEGADQRTVHIQVGLPRGPKAAWLSREMRFQPADAPLERWRAVGFAIGTLAEEQETRRVEELERPEPRAETPVARPAPPRAQAGVERPSIPSTRQHQRWVGLGGLAGPGLDQGAWRFGLWGNVAQRAGASPWFAALSGSYAQARPGDGATVEWFTIAAGIGVAHAATPALQVRARVDLGWQLLRASIDDATGRTDHGTRRAWGPRAGLQTAWRVTQGVSLAAGLEGWKLSSATEIRLRGARLGSSPSLGLAAQLGVEFFLP